jgi:phosphoribosyl 1,2-cyclic phosphate phosphodiesterase
MSLKFILLGCGSSMGVPRPDGYWGKCNPKESRNYRTRCSALISGNNLNILIDTSPDLRFQLIKQKIKNIHNIIYSHLHADQTHGINDLRVFYHKNKKKIDVYANKATKKYLLNNFSYCFKKKNNYPPTLKLNLINKNLTFSDRNKKIHVKCVPVTHGSIKCLSFIINNSCAYAPDVNKIHNKDLKHFRNLKYFIVDCLRIKEHPAHYNLNEVLNLIKIIKPKKTILTNLHTDLDYNYLLKILPNNVIPAHDGLSLNL